MQKTNCWEYNNCGRQPGGSNEKTLGVCPTTKENRLNGVHGGMNGGRACWAIVGSFSSGEMQCTLAIKLGSCITCNFYNMVKQHELMRYKSTPEILGLIA